jgi:hypothetical protein
VGVYGDELLKLLNLHGCSCVWDEALRLCPRRDSDGHPESLAMLGMHSKCAYPHSKALLCNVETA